MSARAYLFEEKGVQRYVLEGGKLVDISGASELAAAIAKSDESDLLSAVLDAVGFKGACRFSRRSGGSFLLHYQAANESAFGRFHALWRMAVQMAAPGLEFSEAFASGDSDAAALEAAYRHAVAVRCNGPATLLPIAGPFVARSRRTGGAAVDAPTMTVDEGDVVDLVTLRKRQTDRLIIKSDSTQNLAGRFAPNPWAIPSNLVMPTDGWRWPRTLEQEEGSPNDLGGFQSKQANATDLFPFRPGKRWIAIVHADISGLGQKLQRFKALTAQDGKQDVVERYFEFSKAIESAIESAAQEASAYALVRHEIDGVLPGRPILLGGDDLTILVRADLAIPYVRTLLEELERRSKEALKRFSRMGGSPETSDQMLGELTACAGIAVIKPKQPFYLANELAVDLCQSAKAIVKAGLAPDQQVPSAIAFHRVTNSAADTYDDIVRRELTTLGHQLTNHPYLVGTVDKEGIPQLAALDDLSCWLMHTPGRQGPLRQIRSLMFTDIMAAKKAYESWRKTVTSRNGDDELRYFDTLLKRGAAGEPIEDDLPFSVSGKSPLFDAIEWNDFR